MSSPAVPGARVPGALPRLCLVTDPVATAGRDLVAVVDAALSGLPPGGALVWLRDKTLEGRALLALARALLAITGARACPLVIGDRVDVALAAGAAGAHLPERGLDLADARPLVGPGGLLGRSTHGVDAASAAAASGADYIMLGPVWDTPAKRQYGAPLGLDVLAGARAASQGAVIYAIGGVDGPARARAAVAAGAHGVAAIRAFLAAPDPARAAAALHAAVHVS